MIQNIILLCTKRKEPRFSLFWHHIHSPDVFYAIVFKGTGIFMFFFSVSFGIYLFVTLQEAVKGQFWRLRDPQGKPPGVMGWWPSRAVTFIDNHDTGSTQVQRIS